MSVTVVQQLYSSYREPTMSIFFSLGRNVFLYTEINAAFGFLEFCISKKEMTHEMIKDLAAL